jgi:hypothetical protein
VTTRVRRSTLLQGFPVEPARSDRSRIAVEVRQGQGEPFVSIEHQIRPDEASEWHCRRSVAIRIEEAPDLIDVLRDALETCQELRDREVSE